MPQENSGENAAEIPVLVYERGWAPLPYLVSAYHIILLVLCGLVLLKIAGLTNVEALKILGIPVSPVVTQIFCFGVIGGTLCASRWVIMAMGRRIYDKNRLLWQLMIPVHGGFLAIFVLVAVRAGLMSITGANQTDAADDPDRYQWLILSLAFLSGFASKVLIERIEGMARALFGSEPENQSAIAKQTPPPEPDDQSANGKQTPPPEPDNQSANGKQTPPPEPDNQSANGKQTPPPEPDKDSE
jgi:hypothetical protein